MSEHVSPPLVLIPENAPFSADQRSWLSGYFAALLGPAVEGATALAPGDMPGGGQKLADNDDPDFRTRAVLIKEQRSELVKHHLWVLWTDYFKPPHFEKHPELHGLVNEATKLAGASGTKGAFDEAVAEQLLAKIDEIDTIFKATKAA